MKGTLLDGEKVMTTETNKVAKTATKKANCLELS